MVRTLRCIINCEDVGGEEGGGGGGGEGLINFSFM